MSPDLVQVCLLSSVKTPIVIHKPPAKYNMQLAVLCVLFFILRRYVAESELRDQHHPLWDRTIGNSVHDPILHDLEQLIDLQDSQPALPLLWSEHFPSRQPAYYWRLLHQMAFVKAELAFYIRRLSLV